jgi:hypothetical protein
MAPCGLLDGTYCHHLDIAVYVSNRTTINQNISVRLETHSHLINQVRVVCVPSAGVTRSRVLRCHRAFPFVLHDEPLGEDFLWKTYDENFYMGLQPCRNARSLQYVMSGSWKFEVIVPDFGGVKARAHACVCVCVRAREREIERTTGYTFLVTHVQK